MTEELRLPAYAKKALARLTPEDRVIRTASGTEEALTKGGGFLFSVQRTGRAFPAGSGRLLIEVGALEPINDGLIPEISQTYRVASHG